MQFCQLITSYISLGGHVPFFPLRSRAWYLAMRTARQIMSKKQRKNVRRQPSAFIDGLYAERYYYYIYHFARGVEGWSRSAEGALAVFGCCCSSGGGGNDERPPPTQRRNVTRRTAPLLSPTS